MKTKKWYKLKDEVAKSTDPEWIMIGLLCEVLGVRIQEDKLKQLPFTVQFLFEETDPPKKLTKTVESDKVN